MYFILGEILENYTVCFLHRNTGVYLSESKHWDAAENKFIRVVVGAEEKEENHDSSSVAPLAEKQQKQNKKNNKNLLNKAQREVDESVLGVFIHKSSLEQHSEKELWEKKNKPGKVMNVRVMGYHLVEGYVVGSNVEGVLDGSVIHVSQVKAGQLLEVEVASIGDFGAVVLVGGKVRALCPSIHMSDASTGSVIAKNKQKFKVGQKLTMRVWEAIGNSVIMTNKKSLLDDLHPIVSCYDDIVVGQVAVGVVSKVSSKTGLRVHFFNKIKGDIPMSVLVKQGVTDAEDAYHNGQVVKCVILQKIISNSTVKINGSSNTSLVSKVRILLGLNIGDTKSMLADFSGNDMG